MKNDTQQLTCNHNQNINQPFNKSHNLKNQTNKQALQKRSGTKSGTENSKEVRTNKRVKLSDGVLTLVGDTVLKETAETLKITINNSFLI